MTTSDQSVETVSSTGADGRADHNLHHDGHRRSWSSSRTDFGDGAMDVARLVAENEQLRACLDTLPIIEQSKGILMVRYQIDAQSAFALLTRWSSHTNIKLRHISRLLVDASNRTARMCANDNSAAIGPSLDEVLDWLQTASDGPPPV